eukprot:15338862-Ditylum_brightwellii.AAC.1
MAEQSENVEGVTNLCLLLPIFVSTADNIINSRAFCSEVETSHICNKWLNSDLNNAVNDVAGYTDDRDGHKSSHHQYVASYESSCVQAPPPGPHL